MANNYTDEQWGEFRGQVVESLKAIRKSQERLESEFSKHLDDDKCEFATIKRRIATWGGAFVVLAAIAGIVMPLILSRLWGH